jgi:riboflavin biosynthesis pyrimidine reductase
VRQVYPRQQDLGTTEAVRAADPTRAGAEADDLVAALAELYAYPDRAWTRGNMIASVDGAIEVGGRSTGLSGPADRLIFTVLRSLADVILVGSGTAKAEHYGKASRVWPQLRQGRPSRPAIAAVTGNLSLDLDSPLITGTGPRTILLTTSKAPRDRRDLAAQHADVVIAGDDSVSARTAVEKLTGLGYRHILAEGGPTLLGELAATGQLDELCVTVSPALEGGYSTARMLKASGPGGDLTPLTLASVIEADGFLLSRYARAENPAEDPQ